MEIVLANNGASILHTQSATSYSEIESTIRRRFRYDLSESILVSAKGEVLKLKPHNEQIPKAFLILRNQPELNERALIIDQGVNEDISKELSGLDADSVVMRELQKLGVRLLREL